MFNSSGVEDVAMDPSCPGVWGVGEEIVVCRQGRSERKHSMAYTKALPSHLLKPGQVQARS